LAKLPRFYWDSCAWLGLLNGEPDKKRELEIVYGNAKNGKCEIWTSTIAFIEVNRLAPEKSSPRPLEDGVSKTIDAIFQQPFVKPIPLDVEIGHRARKLYRETPTLEFRDAGHVASAVRWSIPVFHTYDGGKGNGLIDLSGKFQLKDGSAALIICYPDSTTDGPLFANSKG
jgi:predicted nucleic acid-binding protein